MSKRKPVQFPILLQDGGWRERRKKDVYWPQYFRVRNRVKQLVFLSEDAEGFSAWILKSGDLSFVCGSLDKALIKADVAT